MTPVSQRQIAYHSPMMLLAHLIGSILVGVRGKGVLTVGQMCVHARIKDDCYLQICI